MWECLSWAGMDSRLMDKLLRLSWRGILGILLGFTVRQRIDGQDTCERRIFQVILVRKLFRDLLERMEERTRRAWRGISQTHGAVPPTNRTIQDSDLRFRLQMQGTAVVQTPIPAVSMSPTSQVQGSNTQQRTCEKSLRCWIACQTLGLPQRSLSHRHIVTL
jgi:hypothetical protein